VLTEITLCFTYLFLNSIVQNVCTVVIKQQLKISLVIFNFFIDSCNMLLYCIFYCHTPFTIFIRYFTSSLEPASYITQNSSSKLFIPLSATIIWTCQFNLLHTAITFHHFFAVSPWVQNLPFQKILSSTLVCFCLLYWSHGSRPFTGLICSSFLCFSSILSVLVIPMCDRLSKLLGAL